MFQNAFAAMQDGDFSMSAAVGFALLATCYLAMVLGFGVLSRYFLGRGLWAVVAGSMVLTNVDAIDAAVAAGQPAASLGEGLATDLYVGGI